jgi:hypothetical protein
MRWTLVRSHCRVARAKARAVLDDRLSLPSATSMVQWPSITHPDSINSMEGQANIQFRSAPWCSQKKPVRSANFLSAHKGQAF